MSHMPPWRGACCVRLGLSGDVVCSRFEYCRGWGLRRFKQALQCLWGPLLNRRFDILRGTQKWRFHVHAFAWQFVQGTPGEEIQVVLRSDPEHVLTDLPFWDGTLETPLGNVDWLCMWQATFRSPDYLLLESGASCPVPGHEDNLYICTCVLCGDMGLYSRRRQNWDGALRWRHARNLIGVSLNLCAECGDFCSRATIDAICQSGELTPTTPVS